MNSSQDCVREEYTQYFKAQNLKRLAASKKPADKNIDLRSSGSLEPVQFAQRLLYLPKYNEHD